MILELNAVIFEPLDAFRSFFCELIDEGKLAPALVIGAPVGFVNVVESKELLLRTDVPSITACGRKGGSNVAAAICNAILYTALDAVDPARRQERLK